MEKLAHHPQYAKLARELRRDGKGYREIQNELEKKGLEISHQGVSNYLKKVTSVGARVIQEEGILEEQAVQEILNTNEQMKNVNEELWNLVSHMKEYLDTTNAEINMAAASRLANILDKILKQLELQHKMSQRFSNIGQVNISYLDFSTNMTNYLTKMQEKGAIKIINPDML